MAAEPSEVADNGREGLAGGPDATSRRRRYWWWTVIRRIGQGLMLAGLLVVLFIVWELWGTNWITHRAQTRLRNEFREKIAEIAPPPPSAAPGVPATTKPPPDAVLLPPAGGALARIEIPKIGVDSIVVEGVDAGALRNGPGHYPGTPLPGDAGNVVISGHRTTYGAPFNNLDELAGGDEIVLETTGGRFLYRIEDVFVVEPTDLSVTASDPARQELTLTTCTPKFSASQRLIVRARQEGDAQAVRTI